MKTTLSVLLLPLIALTFVTTTRAAEPDNRAADGQHSGGPKGWGSYRITDDKADPALPRVLLIGDSIAQGYHAEVAKRLKGKANLDLYITPLNVADADYRTKLAKTLAHGPYAVIHYNESGLHAWTPGRVPEGKYGPLFAEALAVLRKNAPGARLIWATNTPVTVKGKPGTPDTEVGKTIADFNTAARAVAEKEGLAIDDLNAVMADKLNLAAGDRWHWNGKGKTVQAAAVTASILAELAKAAPGSKKP